VHAVQGVDEDDQHQWKIDAEEIGQGGRVVEAGRVGQDEAVGSGGEEQREARRKAGEGEEGKPFEEIDGWGRGMNPADPHQVAEADDGRQHNRGAVDPADEDNKRPLAQPRRQHSVESGVRQVNQHQQGGSPEGRADERRRWDRCQRVEIKAMRRHCRSEAKQRSPGDMVDVVNPAEGQDGNDSRCGELQTDAGEGKSSTGPGGGVQTGDQHGRQSQIEEPAPGGRAVEQADPTVEQAERRIFGEEQRGGWGSRRPPCARLRGPARS